MKAELIYYDAMNDIAEVEVAGHHFGLGGPGDSYCYAHQSFDCWEEVPQEVRTAAVTLEDT